MKITRRSGISGQVRTLDLPVTQHQMDEYNKGIKNIQNIMPNLTPDQREFIMTGITAEEWDATFQED